jgi:uncharacterized cupin superfamily protein
MSPMSDPNVFSPDYEPGTPPGVRGQRVGAAAGAQELGAALYELDPGAAVSPYHLHHANEEMLVVLEGRPLVRTPDGARRLEPGAVLAFVRGRDGAHRVANPPDAQETVRILLISTMNLPDVAEHVTTGTVLALTGPAEGRAWAAGSDADFLALYQRSMALDAEEDQRGTSTE